MPVKRPTGPASQRQAQRSGARRPSSSGRAASAVPTTSSAVATKPQTTACVSVCSRTAIAIAAAVTARTHQRARLLLPSCSVPRVRSVSITSPRDARHAGSAAASDAASRPTTAAIASAEGCTATTASGVVILEFSAAAWMIGGRKRWAKPMPAGIPTRVPAMPSRRLSFNSSCQTAGRDTPIARSTPICQARASNIVERPLNAIRNAAPTPIMSSAESRARKARMTLWRSALRWVVASTRKPAGSIAATAVATASGSRSRATTTSSRLIMPRSPKASSAPSLSMTIRPPW